MEKLNIKDVKVFVCVPATGKSYLAEHDNRFVDIDQEESIFKYGLNPNMDSFEYAKQQGNAGKIAKQGSEEYIHNRLLQYIKEGKIILSASHTHILNFF